MLNATLISIKVGLILASYFVLLKNEQSLDRGIWSGSKCDILHFISPKH